MIFIFSLTLIFSPMCGWALSTGLSGLVGLFWPRLYDSHSRPASELPLLNGFISHPVLHPSLPYILIGPSLHWWLEYKRQINVVLLLVMFFFHSAGGSTQDCTHAGKLYPKLYPNLHYTICTTEFKLKFRNLIVNLLAPQCTFNVLPLFSNLFYSIIFRNNK